MRRMLVWATQRALGSYATPGVANVLSIIAVSIAALTFLWTIAWSIYTHREASRPRVVVLGAFALPLVNDQPGPTCVGVTVANTGRVPVTVSSVMFQLERRVETLAVTEWFSQTESPGGPPRRGTRDSH